MKKLLTITITALVATGLSVGAASAKKMHKSHKTTQSSGMTTGSGMGSPTGGNAALSGNSGNSGQGSNSLGHIQGGNVGGGK